MPDLTRNDRGHLVHPSPTGEAGLAWSSNFAELGRTLVQTLVPGPGDDAGQGIVAGDRWLVPALGREWVCVDAAAGAADWREVAVLDEAGQLLGPIIAQADTLATLEQTTPVPGQLLYATDGGGLRVGDGATGGGVAINATTAFSSKSTVRVVSGSGNNFGVSHAIPPGSLVRYTAVLTSPGDAAAPDRSETHYFFPFINFLEEPGTAVFAERVSGTIFPAQKFNSFTIFSTNGRDPIEMSYDGWFHYGADNVNDFEIAPQFMLGGNDIDMTFLIRLEVSPE